MHRYTKHFVGFFVGAALTFFVAQALGFFPTQINYCGDHEANYNNCASHYLLSIPFIWIANHLDAVAAIVTAIATAYIAKFTIVLSRIGGRQEKILEGQQNLQRAYIFGGCGPTGLYHEKDGLGRIVAQPTLSEDGFPQIAFKPGYRNFGQTPAWILEVYTVFCQELPARPDYKSGKHYLISNSLPPDPDDYRNFDFIIMEMKTPTLMYYGRIYYRDMLGQKRHSSFVYRLRNDGGHERIADAHPEYLEMT